MRRYVKFFGVMCLSGVLLVGSAALAQAEEPTIYTVKKGDTLWGLSERFVKDPNYWPSLWANNPEEITNPHQIYPGQRLAVYSDRIEFLPAVAKRQEAAPVIAPAAPVKPILRKAGFVEEAGLSDAGVLIEGGDSRGILATGDNVFGVMQDLQQVQPGEKYLIFKVGEEVVHPVTNKKFGYRVINQGLMEVAKVGEDVVEGRIVESLEEVTPGSRLRRQADAVVAKGDSAAAGASGVVVASAIRDSRIMGQGDYVIIDLGVQAGLEVGSVLSVSRPRRSEGLEAASLPDMVVGTLQVVEVRSNAAIAVVSRAARDILPGDMVATK